MRLIKGLLIWCVLTSVSASGHAVTIESVTDKIITVTLKAGEKQFVPAVSDLSKQEIFIVPRSGNVRVLGKYFVAGKEYWAQEDTLGLGHTFLISSDGKSEQLRATEDSRVDLIYWSIFVR